MMDFCLAIMVTRILNYLKNFVSQKNNAIDYRISCCANISTHRKEQNLSSSHFHEVTIKSFNLMSFEFLLPLQLAT